MIARFLNESVELQTPKNIKKIESILKKPESFYFKRYAKLNLHDLPDGKPGLCCFSGKDSDFSRLLLFIKPAKSVSGEFSKAEIYGYKYFYSESDAMKFDCIASTWDENPKVVRSRVIKLSRFLDSKNMLSFVHNLKKCGFYWEGGGNIDNDFWRFQVDKGNLPKDLKYNEIGK